MASITTERLILREFIPEDLLAVHEYAKDPETTQYLDWGPNSLKETEVFLKESLDFQRAQPRTTYDLAVVISAENRLVGGCSVAIIDQESRTAALGYVLNRAVWRGGYATEAAGAMLNFAFDELGATNIIAMCDALNIGSERVMQKLGMTKVVHKKKDKFLKGKYRDTLVYSIARPA